MAKNKMPILSTSNPLNMPDLDEKTAFLIENIIKGELFVTNLAGSGRRILMEDKYKNLKVGDIILL